MRTFLFFMYEPSGSYGAQARPWSWGHDRPQVMLCALQAFWIYANKTISDSSSSIMCGEGVASVSVWQVYVVPSGGRCGVVWCGVHAPECPWRAC